MGIGTYAESPMALSINPTWWIESRGFSVAGHNATRANLPSGGGDWSTWIRGGNIVIVNIFGAITGGITDGSQIITGLPQAATAAHGVIANGATHATYRITMSGTAITVRDTLPSANNAYAGQIVYFTSEVGQ